MPIVEQTADRLGLEIRPVGLMILCAGLFLLFFVLGFGMRPFLPSITGLMGMPDARQQMFGRGERPRLRSASKSDRRSSV